MPNWKSYDSMVRLVSAIIAAHPSLKLDYAEMAKYHGGGCTYKSIWGQMSQFNRLGDSLRQAFDDGIDPINVNLIEVASSTPKSKAKTEIARNFGGDCTKWGIDTQFRKFKADAVLIAEAVASGQDPMQVVQVGENGRSAKAIGKAFGGGCTYNSIECQFRRYKADARLILQALAEDIDPLTIPIGDKVKSTGSKVPAIASIMGSDVTPNGLRFQYQDRFRPIVNQLLEFQKAGRDGKDVDLEYGSKNSKEIAAFMGGDINGKAIEWQFFSRIRPIAKELSATREDGRDPGTIDVETISFQRGTSNSKTSKKKISKHFGSDSTPGGIGFQFRTIKNDAKRQRACVDSGGDPLSLSIGSGASGGGDATARYFPEATPSALDHFFRPIKKAAKELCANGPAPPGAVAGKLGGGDATPRKRATPAKKVKNPKAAAKKGLNEDGDDDEDDFPVKSDDEFEESPSKRAKANLNKVQSGRVTKARSTKPAPGRFVESDNEKDDEDIIVFSSPIKSEPGRNGSAFTSPKSNGRTNGYANGTNGHTNGHTNGSAGYATSNGHSYESNDHKYYDAPEDMGEEF